MCSNHNKKQGLMKRFISKKLFKIHILAKKNYLTSNAIIIEYDRGMISTQYFAGHFNIHHTVIAEHLDEF